jgi:site-specific recombinase XerD
MDAETTRTELEVVGRTAGGGPLVPTLIADAGEGAARRFFEFFTANIENPNTRLAYAQAVDRFLRWAEARRLTLRSIEPIAVAAYVQELKGRLAVPSVKQHLAAIRMLFAWLVTGQVVPTNPAASVKAPKHVVKRGKTPVLSAANARTLLDAIDASTLVGLQDRLILLTLAYTGARVGAVAALQRGHFYEARDQWMLHFDEKRGKSREIPAAHDLKLLFDAYLERTGIGNERRRRDPVTGEWEPVYLFRTAAGRTGQLTKTPMTGDDIYRMMRRHAERAGVTTRVSPHSFRVAIATDLHEQGVPTDEIQTLLGHSDVRTTNLYQRNRRGVTRNLVERIRLGR